MADLRDVAESILEHRGGRSGTMELHKLATLAQGFHIRYEKSRLFEDTIFPGNHGPQIPAMFSIADGPVAEEGLGDTSRLTDEERATVESTVDQYGMFNGLKLADIIIDLGIMDTIDLDRIRGEQ